EIEHLLRERRGPKCRGCSARCEQVFGAERDAQYRRNFAGTDSGICLSSLGEGALGHDCGGRVQWPPEALKAIETERGQLNGCDVACDKEAAQVLYCREGERLFSDHRARQRTSRRARRTG